MPELPEVETICLGLTESVINLKIDSVIVRHPKLRYPIPKDIVKNLPGKKFHKIQRRGKYILLDTQGGTLIIHLGMSGNLQTKPKNHTIDKHEHLTINFHGKLSLCYIDPRRFGAILWTVKNPLEHNLLKNLGPEPFSTKFTAKYLLERAKNKKTSVKQLIMDSNVVTGVGNIYANEILFSTRVNPLKKASELSLSNCEKLVKSIKKTLALAIKLRGTTIKDHLDSKGKKGGFQNKLKVYGKQNQPCPNCNGKLSMTKLGQRTTIFCPNCQK